MKGDVFDGWVGHETAEQEVLAFLELRETARSDKHTKEVGWV